MLSVWGFIDTLRQMTEITQTPLRKSQQEKISRKRRRTGFTMLTALIILAVAGWTNVRKSTVTKKALVSTPTLSSAPADSSPANIPNAMPNTKTPKWTAVTIKSGQSLAVVFQNMGFSSLELHNVMQAGPEVSMLNRLLPGQTIFFNHEGAALDQIKIEKNVYETLLVTKKDALWTTQIEKAKITAQTKEAMVVIEDSLYMSGKKAGLSDAVIMQITEIYAWDIDFAWDIREGDRFSIVYAQQYKDGKKISDGPVLAAEFINQGRVKRAVRYTHPDGRVSYYDENGHSMRKAFLRSPVDFARISSGFRRARFHPVLKRTRAHKGVDYAARTGTPIKASGDGKVIHKGRKGGYGHTVILAHGGTYTTLYAHMSRYAKGVYNGARVKQGQIIGYIGRSGLATGPHLHYEFRVRGVHQNPLTVKLPKAKAISPEELEAFNAYAGPMFTRLNAHIEKQTQVAASTPVQDHLAN